MKRMFLRAITEKVKWFESNHISTFDTINNLEDLYVTQNKLLKIKKMYFQILIESEKTLKLNHSSTFIIIYNFIKLYKD